MEDEDRHAALYDAQCEIQAVPELICSVKTKNNMADAKGEEVITIIILVDSRDKVMGEAREKTKMEVEKRQEKEIQHRVYTPVREMARGFLAQLLSEGSRNTKDIFPAAEKHGIKRMTLYGAKHEMHISSIYHGFGEGKVCLWALS